MRKLIDLFESLTPTLYHGSRSKFPDGYILTAQPNGYVTHEDAEPSHILTEKILEKHRPPSAVSRFNAVFLINDPELIDYAGGYTDYIYEVEPTGNVSKCNLAWYSELYLICEDAVYSNNEAETTEMVSVAKKYWSAASKDNSDLFEYLTETAIVIKELD